MVVRMSALAAATCRGPHFVCNVECHDLSIEEDLALEIGCRKRNWDPIGMLCPVGLVLDEGGHAVEVRSR